MEGTGLTLRALVTDPGADVFTYHWDFGDGSPPASGGTLSSLTHVYADEGTYTITLVVDDGDGGTTSRSLTVVVADISTAASMSGPTQVVEGSPYTLTLSAFIPEAAVAISSWVVDWGDGTVVSYAGDGSVSHTYADGPASHTIHVDVVKTAGGTSTIGTLPVQVLNAVPRITSLTGDTTGTEGQTRQFAAAASDPGDDILTFTWDFGDGTAPVTGVGLTSVQHAFADDGAYVVTLVVSDDDGASDVRHRTALISNVAPTATLAGAASMVEGAAYVLTLGAPNDPGADTVTQWIVDWGDGHSDTYATSGEVTHTYADGPDSHLIRLSLVDEDGVHRDVAQLLVAVANAAPHINAIAASANPVEGSVTTLTADVVDPAGPYDLLTYRWNLGDGSPMVQGVNLASVRHVYADDGVYSVTLQVWDEDGDSTTSVYEVSVANVAPITVLSGQPTAVEGSPTP